MGKIINRVGEIYLKLEIIEELGGAKVRCRCIECGHTDMYGKGNVLDGKIKCRKCSPGNLINRVGEVFNNLQILQELGKRKVLARCLLCNSEKEYVKTHITLGNQKSCGCLNSRYVDRTGQTFKGIKVIQELVNREIIGECIHCGSTKNYNRDTVLQGGRQSCGCLISGIKSRVGQQYGRLKIIKELGKARVNCQCIDCNTIAEYFKQQVVENRAICSYCGISTNRTFKRLESKIINNVTVISYEYTGRDKNQYYKCKCNACQEELLLNHTEIIKYVCIKE